MVQICTKCKIEKPLTLEFFYFKKQRNKFYRECIICYSERNKTKKITNEQRKKYNETKKKYYYERYKGSESHRKSAKAAKKKWLGAKAQNRLIENLRGRTRVIIKRKQMHKTGKFKEYIGCDYETLIKHIENQFLPGMTWNNYGIYGWHIDHIVPLISAKTVEELYKLCHYTNLQPLWAQDNYKKKDKLPPF